MAVFSGVVLQGTRGHPHTKCRDRRPVLQVMVWGWAFLLLWGSWGGGAHKPKAVGDDGKCLENAAMQQRGSVLESPRFVLHKSTSTSYECVAGLRLGMGGNSEPAVVSLQLINMDLA